MKSNKKNNEELKHLSADSKLTKKNIVIIVVPIIISVIVIAVIAYGVFVLGSPNNKLKSYLSAHNYTCNNETCSISVNDTTEVIDYNTGILTISNVDYTYMVNKDYVSYQDNTKELVCTYRHSKYKFYEPIDASFTADSNCEVYIDTINKTIDKYHELFTSADIDVNKLEN